MAMTTKFSKKLGHPTKAGLRTRIVHRVKRPKGIMEIDKSGVTLRNS